MSDLIDKLKGREREEVENMVFLDYVFVTFFVIVLILSILIYLGEF